MNIKNGDLRGLIESFDNLKSLTGFPFIKALYKNKKLIKDEMEILDEIKEESKDFKELGEKVNIIKIKYADKDSDGNPIAEDQEIGNGKIIKKLSLTKSNEKKLIDEIRKLEEDNKNIIEAQRKREIEYIETLQKECSIEFHKIEESDIPKEINMEQLETVDFMVEFK